MIVERRLTGSVGIAVLLLCGAIVSAQPHASPDRVIEYLDEDGDGRVSLNEFETPRRGPERNRLSAADNDNDGNVSREEMQAHVDQRTAAAFERFERADRNNDGLLTEQEIKQAHFDRLDKNGDGYVDAVELGNARRARGRGQAG